MATRRRTRRRTRKKAPPPSAEAIARYPFKRVPLSKMTRQELLRLALRIGRAWERRTQRNQDLEGLQHDTAAQIRAKIREKWRPEMAQIWADWE